MTSIKTMEQARKWYRREYTGAYPFRVWARATFKERTDLVGKLGFIVGVQ